MAGHKVRRLPVIDGHQLIGTLRAELKDTDVTVTALMPGPTDTNFFHRADMDDTKVGASEKDDPAQVAQQGFQAMRKDQEKVVAGSLKTKAQGAARAGRVCRPPRRHSNHAELDAWVPRRPIAQEGVDRG
jgi:NAD(P)-dependent dehydrogenase (short-subunit alcohol dehydrogenase family)